MSLGAAAGGGLLPLQEILKARALREIQDRQLQQQAFENQQSTARLGLEQQRVDNEGVARQQAMQDRTQGLRDKAATMTVGALQPNQVVDGSDLSSILGTEQQGRLQPQRTLPSSNPLTGASIPSDGQTQSVTLRPTTAERNTETASAESLRRFNLGQMRNTENAQRSDANIARVQSNADRQFGLAQSNAERAQANSDRQFAASQAKGDEVKVSAAGKKALASIEQGAPLIDQVMSEIAKTAPGIDTAKEDSPYNGVGNRLSNQASWLKYQAGFGGDESPTIQITKLLQPVTAGQYMSGSRNVRMLDLVLQHLADPTQTTYRQYEALKTLKGLMPEMREAIINSERPINLKDINAHTNAPAGGGSGRRIDHGNGVVEVGP